jgi:hypothetical protein
MDSLVLVCDRNMIQVFYSQAPDSPSLARSKSDPGAHAQSSPAANFYDSADWWQLRSAIMKALQDFPEARDSVVRALRDLHALQDPNAPRS